MFVFTERYCSLTSAALDKKIVADLIEATLPVPIQVAAMEVSFFGDYQIIK